MKTKKRILYILLVGVISIVAFVFFFSDPKSVRNVEKPDFKDKCRVKQVGTKSFRLDDETKNLLSYLQYIENDSCAYLSFINEYNNSIYFYNYSNSQFSHKLKYEKEGNNGVGRIQGYCYINEDSIYVYSYGASRLYLTNNQCNVLDSPVNLFERPKEYTEKSMFLPSPFVQTNNPIKSVNNRIILGGFFSGESLFETASNSPVNVLYNTKDKTIEYANNYPEQYQKYHWGGGFTYRMPHFEVNNDLLIVSFAADHNLLCYSLKNATDTTYYAGSSEIDQIKSYSSRKMVRINKDKAWKWYMENPSYEGIFYDKYNDLYYRIARLPNQDFNENETGNRKPVVVIVLDSKFNYIGEEKLPGDLNLNPSNCFVTKDGFNIQQLNDDEDMLTFCQFKIIRNENL